MNILIEFTFIFDLIIIVAFFIIISLHWPHAFVCEQQHLQAAMRNILYRFTGMPSYLSNFIMTKFSLRVAYSPPRWGKFKYN